MKELIDRMNTTLPSLSIEIYNGNESRGFWDSKRGTPISWPLLATKLALVISEISEAIEADRAGKHANVEMYMNLMRDEERDFVEHHFRTCIKDTVEDELADVAIRLLDLTGRIYEYLPMDIDVEPLVESFSPKPEGDCFPQKMYEIMETVTSITASEQDMNAQGLLNNTCKVIVILFTVCHLRNIDLMWHVEEKLKFNATRPHKHGKSY